MIPKGINEIAAARLCPACQLAMEQTYVMRCEGSMGRGFCERCGKESFTLLYLYTMRGKEKVRRGIPI